MDREIDTVSIYQEGKWKESAQEIREHLGRRKLSLILNEMTDILKEIIMLNSFPIKGK